MGHAFKRQRRDANDAALQKIANQMGVQVWELHTPVDWLCLGWNEYFMIEIKDEKQPPSRRRLTEQQAKFVLATVGSRRYKVCNERELLEALDIQRTNDKERYARYERTLISEAVEIIRERSSA